MLSVMFLPTVPAWSIGLHLAVFGIGTGLFHATNNAEVMSAAPAEKSSLAGSLLALVRYLGQIVGIGLATVFVGTMGSLAQIHESHGVSIRILFGICCALCLAVAIAGRYLPKEKPNSPNLSAS